MFYNSSKPKILCQSFRLKMEFQLNCFQVVQLEMECYRLSCTYHNFYHLHYICSKNRQKPISMFEFESYFHQTIRYFIIMDINGIVHLALEDGSIEDRISLLIVMEVNWKIWHHFKLTSTDRNAREYRILEWQQNQMKWTNKEEKMKWFNSIVVTLESHSHWCTSKNLF